MERLEAVTYVRCPVHGELVAVNLWKELLGRCAGCITDAAQALNLLSKEAA